MKTLMASGKLLKRAQGWRWELRIGGRCLFSPQWFKTSKEALANMLQSAALVCVRQVLVLPG